MVPLLLPASTKTSRMDRSMTTSNWKVPSSLMVFPTENRSVKKGLDSANPLKLRRESQTGASPPRKMPPETDSRVVEEEKVKFRVPCARVLLGMLVTLQLM